MDDKLCLCKWKGQLWPAKILRRAAQKPRGKNDTEVEVLGENERLWVQRGETAPLTERRIEAIAQQLGCHTARDPTDELRYRKALRLALNVFARHGGQCSPEKETPQLSSWLDAASAQLAGQGGLSGSGLPEACTSSPDPTAVPSTATGSRRRSSRLDPRRLQLQTDSEPKPAPPLGPQPLPEKRPRREGTIGGVCRAPRSVSAEHGHMPHHGLVLRVGKGTRKRELSRMSVGGGDREQDGQQNDGEDTRTAGMGPLKGQDGVKGGVAVPKTHARRYRVSGRRGTMPTDLSPAPPRDTLGNELLTKVPGLSLVPQGRVSKCAGSHQPMPTTPAPHTGSACPSSGSHKLHTQRRAGTRGRQRLRSADGEQQRGPCSDVVVAGDEDRPEGTLQEAVAQAAVGDKARPGGRLREVEAVAGEKARPRGRSREAAARDKARPQGRPREVEVETGVKARPGGRPREAAVEVEAGVKARPRGRPREAAVKVEAGVKARPRGRPREAAVEEAAGDKARPRGRPRKATVEVEAGDKARPRGRLREATVEVEAGDKARPRGRPREVEVETGVKARPRGRPREAAVEVEAGDRARPRGRPREATVEVEAGDRARPRGRPREAEVEAGDRAKPRGRPREAAVEVADVIPGSEEATPPSPDTLPMTRRLQLDSSCTEPLEGALGSPTLSEGFAGETSWVSDLSIELSVQGDPSPLKSSLLQDEGDEQEDEELPSFLLQSDRKPGEIKEGNCIWCKYRSYPYWPAVVKAINRKKKKVSIIFIDPLLFETQRGLSVGMRSIKPFDCELKDQLEAEAKIKYRAVISWCLELIQDYRCRIACGSFSGSFMKYFADDISCPVRRMYVQGSSDVAFPSKQIMEEQGVLLPNESEDGTLDLQSDHLFKKLLPDRSKAARNLANEKLVEFIVEKRGVEKHLQAIISGQASSKWRMALLKTSRTVDLYKTYLEDEDQVDQVYRYLDDMYKNASQTAPCLAKVDGVRFILDVLFPEAVVHAIAGVFKISLEKAEDKYLKGPSLSERERAAFDRSIEEQMTAQSVTRCPT